MGVMLLCVVFQCCELSGGLLSFLVENKIKKNIVASGPLCEAVFEQAGCAPIPVEFISFLLQPEDVMRVLGIDFTLLCVCIYVCVCVCTRACALLQDGKCGHAAVPLKPHYI